MKFEELRDLVRARRTDMMVDKDRALDDGVLEKLCELAMWAPNHKLTFPWMFAAVTNDARERLSNCTADAMARDGDKPEKIAKARTKFQRAPYAYDRDWNFPAFTQKDAPIAVHQKT